MGPQGRATRYPEFERAYIDNPHASANVGSCMGMSPNAMKKGGGPLQGEGILFKGRLWAHSVHLRFVFRWPQVLYTGPSTVPSTLYRLVVIRQLKAPAWDPDTFERRESVPNPEVFFTSQAGTWAEATHEGSGPWNPDFLEDHEILKDMVVDLNPPYKTDAFPARPYSWSSNSYTEPASSLNESERQVIDLQTLQPVENIGIPQDFIAPNKRWTETFGNGQLTQTGSLTDLHQSPSVVDLNVNLGFEIRTLYPSAEHTSYFPKSNWVWVFWMPFNAPKLATPVNGWLVPSLQLSSTLYYQDID